MKLFKLKNDNLEIIPEESVGDKLFDYEKTLQHLIENNLDALFPNLEFVKSEYEVEDFRIDTLAYDAVKKSFVIIEYKNIKNNGIMDQGFAYYTMLDKHKGDFVLSYNDIKHKSLTKNDIAWDEIRLIFIAPRFTKFQIQASSYNGLPIELYQIRKYAHDIITLDRIESNKIKNASADSITAKKPILREYFESEYLDGRYDGSKILDETRKLYCGLKDAILDKFDQDVECRQKKKYVSFYLKINGSAICTIEVNQKQLKLAYSTKKQNLLPKIDFIKDMTNIGHLGLGNYQSIIQNETDIPKALEYIELVYNDNSS